MANKIIEQDLITQLMEEVLEARYPGMKPRIERISECAGKIAKIIGKDDDYIERISKVARLSFISFTTFPDDLLVKPYYKLSPRDTKYFNRYQRISARLIKKIDPQGGVAELVMATRFMFHGEEGISGTKIPLESRILLLVHRFDQLMFPFNHRLPLSINRAMWEIMEARSEFDPDLVNVFLNNVLSVDGYDEPMEVMVHVQDLKKGMVLAKRMFDAEGRKLLREGTELNEVSLEKINLIPGLKEMDTTVAVHRESVVQLTDCPRPALPAPIIKIEEKEVSTKPLVVVVDDEAGIVNTLKWQLKRASYNVVGFSDPKQALGRATEGDVFAVISDLNMPGTQGDLLVSSIKEKCPDLPCIIVTGYTSRETIMGLKDVHNFVRILPKPWNEDVLLRTLRELGEETA